MTDRELLEAAAKAYWGSEIDDVCSIRWLEDDQAIGYTHGDNQDHNGIDQEYVWNPLNDDGDALRLAVQLEIGILYVEFSGEAEARWNRGTCRITEYGPNDPIAATRRAIVRAAAEMGK